MGTARWAIIVGGAVVAGLILMPGASASSEAAGGSSRDRATGPNAPLLVASFDEGLSAPWGTGQYADGRPVWWNSGDCSSWAEVDHQDSRGGGSLYIVNPSSRSPHKFGTTQQPVAIEPGQRYRISLWAKTSGLASRGALSIVVDPEWRIRPIQLPAGSYDWTQFSGEFSLAKRTADLRILIEDRGEVWLDSLVIEPVE